MKVVALLFCRNVLNAVSRCTVIHVNSRCTVLVVLSTIVFFLRSKTMNINVPSLLIHTNLREFVKTHVILAPLREFSRSRAASKIPFPGAQPGWPAWPGEPDFFFHFRCKNRYLRSRVI